AARVAVGRLRDATVRPEDLAQPVSGQVGEELADRVVERRIELGVAVLLGQLAAGLLELAALADEPAHDLAPGAEREGELLVRHPVLAHRLEPPGQPDANTPAEDEPLVVLLGDE